ncbi:hypothetical protein ML436_06295 [Staphylococcus roterodami]|nr:hypothetical protein ML436_06295 [Staphylococcus roterodami]
MKNNEGNITDVTQNEEQLDNSDEQSQQNEKTFSQEEVSQLIKERIARERKKSDERIKDAKENNYSNEVGYLLKDGKVTKIYGDQNSASFVPGEKQPNYYLTVNLIQLLCYITILGTLVFLLQTCIYLYLIILLKH